MTTEVSSSSRVRSAEETGPAILTQGLTRRFGDLVAVDHVDLAVEPGELFALLGPNGAGKTTTIRLLCLLLRPTSGSIAVAGHDAAAAPIAVKSAIAVSPQETAIAEHLDAWENLRLMARLHGIDDSEIRRRSQSLLEMFGLADRAKDRVKKFSGGMKRRLSIAMALVTDPEVLFLDEPTLGLDPQSRRGLWEHIEALKGSITIVLTTHYLEEADALADRVAIIDDGRIVAAGTPDELRALVPSGRGTLVEADLDDGAIDALRHRFGSVRAVETGAEIDAPDATVDAIVDVLRPLGIETRSTHRNRITLDDVFVHLTGKELRP